MALQDRQARVEAVAELPVLPVHLVMMELLEWMETQVLPDLQAPTG